MYFDGSLMRKGAGVGLAFISPLGVHIKYSIHLHFPASNNMAEYEVLINNLKDAIELGIRRLKVHGDSQLVVDQIMKESNCHSDIIALYYQEVCKLKDKFDGIELKHIPRKLNEAVDLLAKMASGRGSILNGTFAND